MTANFQLEGQEFIALNGGPVFHFTEAISLLVDCENQAEVDTYWDKLCAGGEPSQCGWLTGALQMVHPHHPWLNSIDHRLPSPRR